MQIRDINLGIGARPLRTNADINKLNTRDVLT